MRLAKLCSALLKSHSLHFKDVEVTSITADSRRVREGALFVAIRGFTHDGHRYLEQAMQAGAVAALVEQPAEELALPQIVVANSRLAGAILADAFYGHPSTRLKMIGVTGTNGKTTTSHLIERILSHAGYTVGLRGTVGKRIAGQLSDVVNTTPDAIDLQQTLDEMVRASCEYGVIEVSSHALEERRDAGTRYRAAVFTNLTQDHLDFHGTMENYRAAKGKLFMRLGNAYAHDAYDRQYGVLNVDDEASEWMMEQTAMECITYGIERPADVRATDVSLHPDGATFTARTFAGDAFVRLSLTGRFNVYNALAAIAVAVVEGVPLETVAEALSSMPVVPGRLERVDAGQDYVVLVDYSHTPDSLENALKTVREFTAGRVLTVIGCGGDRDKTKRPIMAQVAVRYSDFAVFTSDNPRTEDPERILDDMEAGLVQRELVGRHERISDRAMAIERAIFQAMPGDVVLVAGKGHETYQDIARVKHHFDDREVAKSCIERRHLRGESH